MLLGNSDVFVDYSSFQAMGLTAMEAMASGCAVVLPKYGGTGDFAKNESNCLVIDTKNTLECIEQTERLIEDVNLRYELSARAISDMCRYLPERCAVRFMEKLFS